jgi:hypothetical protein
MQHGRDRHVEPAEREALEAAFTAGAEAGKRLQAALAKARREAPAGEKRIMAETTAWEVFAAERRATTDGRAA